MEIQFSAFALDPLSLFCDLSWASHVLPCPICNVYISPVASHYIMFKCKQRRFVSLFWNV